MTRRTPTPRAVLGVASLGVFMAFVDATIVNIAFPDIGREFSDSSVSELSWVLNAYNIVFAAFLVAAGRLADLIGRRRVFISGLNLFTVASLLCAIAPTVGTLIAARVLQALGAALLVPSSLALVLSAFPKEKRSHGVALLSAIAAVAAGLGPSLGGLLVELSDWRLVFLVNIPIGIAAAVLAGRVLVESREPGRRQMPDLIGALLFAPAVGALVYAVTEGDNWGWTSAKTLGLTAVSLVLGAVFVQRCRTHRAPMVDLALLRIRTFSVANAMTIVTSAGFYGYTLTNVLFLTGVWQYGVLKAGLALTPGPFVAAAVAGPTSKLVTRFGHRPVLVAGGLIWGGAVLWMVTQVGPTPDFMREWLPGIVLLGIGAGTLFPNLSGAAVASAPGEAHATAVGLNSVARQVGAAFGVAIVLAVLGTPDSIREALDAFDSAWTFSAVCLIAAGLGSLGVSRLTPHDEASGVVSLADAFTAVLREPAPQPPQRARSAVRPVLPAAHDDPEIPRAESAADFLGQVPLFAGIDPRLREQVAAQAREVRLPIGELLFEAGDEGDAMYVVRAGRLEVLSEDGALLRELGRGSGLGELALLTAMPRSASARAARDTDLLAIDRDAFAELLASAPELSLALNRILAEQLRTGTGGGSNTRPLPVTVALVALEPGIELDAFAEALGVALGRYGSAALLDRTDAAGLDAFGPLVDRAERDAELVLLVADDPFSDDPWTAFALQQADRILALTRGGPVPDRATDTAALHGCDLVGVDVTPGTGALADWVAALEPAATHHDPERLARRLSGRSVGLVLSGGGARAFAHIGVIEELVGAGIEIDRVSGVSFGAYVGALFAQGLDPESIDAHCFDEWVRGRPLGDYRPSRHGLIRGSRLEATLARTFGDVAIEELSRGFSCTSAELRSGRIVVARSGLLRDVVGRSMRLPLLSPPAVRGEELHVDGSLIDNLPVETLAATGEGPVIAVPVDAGMNGHVGDGPPGIAETLARVVALGSTDTAEAARRHATLTIAPHAEGVGLLEFHQIDAAREAGRAAARAALESAPDSVFG